MTKPRISPSHKLSRARLHTLSNHGEDMTFSFPGHVEYGTTYTAPHGLYNTMSNPNDSDIDFEETEGQEKSEDEDNESDEDFVPDNSRRATATSSTQGRTQTQRQPRAGEFEYKFQTKFDQLEHKTVDKQFSDILAIAAKMSKGTTEIVKKRWPALKHHLSTIVPLQFPHPKRPNDQANSNYDVLIGIRTSARVRRALDQCLAHPRMDNMDGLKTILRNVYTKAHQLVEYLEAGKPLKEFGPTFVDLNGLHDWILSGEPLPIDGYRFHTAGNPFLKEDDMNPEACSRRRQIIARYGLSLTINISMSDSITDRDIHTVQAGRGHQSFGRGHAQTTMHAAIIGQPEIRTMPSFARQPSSRSGLDHNLNQSNNQTAPAAQIGSRNPRPSSTQTGSPSMNAPSGGTDTKIAEYIQAALQVLDAVESVYRVENNLKDSSYSLGHMIAEARDSMIAAKTCADHDLAHAAELLQLAIDTLDFGERLHRMRVPTMQNLSFSPGPSFFLVRKWLLDAKALAVQELNGHQQSQQQGWPAQTAAASHPRSSVLDTFRESFMTDSPGQSFSRPAASREQPSKKRRL